MYVFVPSLYKLHNLKWWFGYIHRTLNKTKNNQVNKWRFFQVGDKTVGTDSAVIIGEINNLPVFIYVCLYMWKMVAEHVFICCVFKWTKCCKRLSRRLHNCWVLVKRGWSYCTHGCFSWVILRLFYVCVSVSFGWDSIGSQYRSYVVVFLCVHMNYVYKLYADL